MEAATLNCPMCGAPCASDATNCEHCSARLATVACPSCFGMIFLGSKFCQHCGGKIERVESSASKPKSCPRCRVNLKPIALGWAQMHECKTCNGLWVDVDTFNEICANREKQAAILGGASPNPVPAPLECKLDDVRYVPCPVCGTLMNRVSFARGAGVIVDICKGHGTWFDRDELRHIVEFIRAGGLEQSRERDREDWASQQRQRKLSPPGGGIDTPILGDIGRGSWRETNDLLDLIGWIGIALIKLFVK